MLHKSNLPSKVFGLLIYREYLIFVMNMPFNSSSEVKNAFFMSVKATNEIYIYSHHNMK